MIEDYTGQNRIGLWMSTVGIHNRPCQKKNWEMWFYRVVYFKEKTTDVLLFALTNDKK